MSADKTTLRQLLEYLRDPYETAVKVGNKFGHSAGTAAGLRRSERIRSVASRMMSNQPGRFHAAAIVARTDSSAPSFIRNAIAKDEKLNRKRDR